MNENIETAVSTETATETVAPVASKKGRGRTKGSYSFITVPASAVAGMPFLVVSRKWAEAAHIAGNAVAVNSLETFKKAVVSETPTPALQVSVEE